MTDRIDISEIKCQRFEDQARAALESSRREPEREGVWLWTQISGNVYTHPADDDGYHAVIFCLDTGVYHVNGMFGKYSTRQEAFRALADLVGFPNVRHEWVRPGEQARTQEEVIEEYMADGRRCGYHNPETYATEYVLAVEGNRIAIQQAVTNHTVSNILTSEPDSWDRARAWVYAHAGEIVRIHH